MTQETISKISTISAISSYRKNCMGTISFMAKFSGMRKPQEFIVYPLPDAAQEIKIQSDTRIGKINLESGNITLSPPRAGGSYNIHLMLATDVGTLSGEELLLLKSNLFSTASGSAGSRGVTVDNKGALEVFEATRAAA